jgi:Zn-dependent protease
VLQLAHVREQLLQISLWILPVLVAVVFHEVAHGYVANWLGDDTARRAGRLTLNPLPHIDPLGSVILPLLLLVTHAGFLFGWAKPVPVNFGQLRRPKRDMVLVAAAGPLTNLVLATAAALLLRAIVTHAGHGQGALFEGLLVPVAMIAQYTVLMNVFLGVFNMLPIPPLDGGRVLTGLLPLDLARRFARIEPFGFLILILLLMSQTLGLLIRRPIQVLLDVLLPR